MTNSTSSEIITPEQFEKYSSNWTNAVSQSDASLLAQAFAAPDTERLLYVSFPLMRIVGLVSAVGAAQIKARFLLVPDESDANLHFSVALFAANVQEEAVSAYYVPEPYWSNAAAPTLGQPVPHDLVALWLDNWKSAPELAPAMFTTAYGPLEGYNFDVNDFLDPLFAAQPFGAQHLRLFLGLHQYYAAQSTGENLTQTLGLVARLFSPDETPGIIDDALFYDMSGPCPPNQ